MLANFIPEAVALGALLATGASAAPLLAFLIGLLNLPEGFNAFRELKKSSPHKSREILTQLGLLACLGPFAGVAGHLWLVGFPEVLGVLMLFAGGGILYLLFQDIAPQTPLKNSWIPPLGAIGGFALGLAGHLIVG